MQKKPREHEQLRRGKAFHKKIQAEWKPELIEDGSPRCEAVIRSGRVDVLVEELGDFVSVVEIKSTNWDNIAPHRVVPLLHAHRRQCWKYITEFVDRHKTDVCPGVIYPRAPSRAGLKEKVEEYLNDYGIQVVWHDDP